MAGGSNAGRRLLATIAVICAVGGLVLAASAMPMLASDAPVSGLATERGDGDDRHGSTDFGGAHAEGAQQGVGTHHDDSVSGSPADGPQLDGAPIADRDLGAAETVAGGILYGLGTLFSVLGGDGGDDGVADAGETLEGGAVADAEADGAAEGVSGDELADETTEDTDPADGGMGGEFGELLTDGDDPDEHGMDTDGVEPTAGDGEDDAIPTDVNEGDSNEGLSADDAAVSDADHEDGPPIDDDGDHTGGDGEDANGLQSGSDEGNALEPGDEDGDALESTLEGADGLESEGTSESDLESDDGTNLESADELESDGDAADGFDSSDDGDSSDSIDSDGAIDAHGTDEALTDELGDGETAGELGDEELVGEEPGDVDGEGDHSAASTDGPDESVDEDSSAAGDSSGDGGDGESALEDATPDVSTTLLLIVALALVAAVVGYLCYRLDDPIATVLSIPGRIVSFVVSGVVACSQALERALGALRGLGSIRELPALVLAAIGGLFQSARTRTRTVGSAIGLFDETGSDADEIPEDGTHASARERIERAFEAVIDASTMYRARVATATPSDVARSAKRAGAPTGPVETITDAFRDVEYGERDPEPYVDPTDAAHERLRSALESPGDDAASEADE
ncbi:hypothetical protein AB7C87_12145 [Natrarchaeobius sp. A-rgal3]|uniref:hypothetical protein n=1 Tax=Natrarchaeobius versutus TaxID=1679078 RepID=UPI00350E9AE1